MLAQFNSWCSIPGQLLNQHGVIWLNEPAHSNRYDLAGRLLDGGYGKPFVVDDGVSRRLHFDFQYVQSEMSLARPDELVSAYTQKMMSFLLFAQKPKHVTIVGLGGGALTKFIYRQLPSTRVTTVEVNPDVIALSALFDIPAPDSRMKIIHADAVDYFKKSGSPVDVILLDGCDNVGIAPTLNSLSFYESLSARLRPHGVLVLNLIGCSDRASMHLRHISRVFSNKFLVVNVGCNANRIAFAFNDSQFLPDWERIRSRAEILEFNFGLDFSRFARLLQRSCKLKMSHGNW